MAEAGSGDRGAPLRVDPNAILTARGHLDSVAEELQAALRRLVAEVEDVVGVSWRGEASGVFTRYWQAFHDAAAEVTEDASVIAEMIQVAATRYLREDATGAQRIGGAGL
jgi:WXG100 family type VII secretion target